MHIHFGSHDDNDGIYQWLTIFHRIFVTVSLWFKTTERLLLRRCNRSNIGGRVYVTVRVSVRVIFSITWPRPATVTYVLDLHRLLTRTIFDSGFVVFR